MHRRLLIVAQNINGRLRYFSFPAKKLVVLLLLVLLNGCATKKQTWEDWLKARAASGKVPQMPASPTFVGRTNVLVCAPGYNVGDGAKAGPRFNLAMRNPDFPRTHIEAVYIDLSSQTNGVHIKWTGPMATNGPVGPWRHTPGRGNEGVNCDCDEEYNVVDSRCTPKGSFPVAGFSDHLYLTPTCLYVTWVLHAPRYIGMHSHTDLPDVPASSGCIRMPYEAAKLIHNNSIVGVTVVDIYGSWKRAPIPRNVTSTPIINLSNLGPRN